ncbi:MAG: hypothetical protein N3D17_00680 [bacterium]|nr:hypothetical protein [bacterium]
MKEYGSAILLGLLSGLVLYSVIGWMFTKQSPVGRKYLIQVVFFLVILILSLILIIPGGILQ